MYFHIMIHRIPISAPTLIYFIWKCTLGPKEPSWKIENMIFWIPVPKNTMIKLFLAIFDNYPFQKCTHIYAWFSQLLEMIGRFREKRLMLNSIEKRLGMQVRICCKIRMSGEFLKKNDSFRLAKKTCPYRNELYDTR